LCRTFDWHISGGFCRYGGAAIGAFVGYLYPKGRGLGSIGAVILKIIGADKRLFGKLRKR